MCAHVLVCVRSCMCVLVCMYVCVRSCECVSVRVCEKVHGKGQLLLRVSKSALKLQSAFKVKQNRLEKGRRQRGKRERAGRQSGERKDDGSQVRRV